MIAIIGIRNYTHYTLYRSCLPIYGIAIVRSLSFLPIDDLEGNANIFVAIKSDSTVCRVAVTFYNGMCGWVWGLVCRVWGIQLILHYYLPTDGI